MSAARQVRVTFPGLAYGPSVVDLDSGEELGRRLPALGARAFIGVKPGEHVKVVLFRLDEAGEKFCEGNQPAMETLDVLVAELIRPINIPAATPAPSCGCQLCPRHQVLLA